MKILTLLLDHYGWEGLALAALLLLFLCIQLYYWLSIYGRLPKYRDSHRAAQSTLSPAISVIIPLFAEDYGFIEQTLPALTAQDYPEFEVVLVYVGRDADFFDLLMRLKQGSTRISATKIELNPQFPISPKMALNVGIKSARHEHLLFTTPDCTPASTRWLHLMAQGFRRGDVVLGYCGLESQKNYLMRMWRMMGSVAWLARAVKGRPYRACRQNYGFTKTLYFGANGFSHLNMNIGEDDLFLQKIMHTQRVSVVLSPRAAMRERCWGGLRWWSDQQRYYGSAAAFYPRPVRNYIDWEWVSRVLLWVVAAIMIVLFPPEVQVSVALLLLIRLSMVLVQVRRIAKRLGERRVWVRYTLYDLWSPMYALYLRILRLRRDDRVWR